MQSYLQYRRFGKHVAAQYERDKDRVKGGEPYSSLPISSVSTPPTLPDGPPLAQDHNSYDLEKNEETTGNKTEGTEDRSSIASPSPGDTLASQESQNARQQESILRRASKVETHQSTGTNLGMTLTGINVRDRRTNDGGEKGSKVFVVDYKGEKDNMNPHNWSYATRLFATFNIAQIGFIVGFASSVDSAALQQWSKAFGVSEVVESLATGLFLVGFGVGSSKSPGSYF